MSTYVCSDIHGCYTKFKKMLKKINFSLADTMYILGDIIDRGPESITMLQDIMSRKNIIALLGNHEYMMFNAIMSGDLNLIKLWLKNGGSSTFDEYRKLSEDDRNEILDYILNMPIIIDNVLVNGKTFYLTHSHYIYGDVPQKNNLSNIPAKQLEQAIWKRFDMNVNITNTLEFKKHQNKYMIAGHTCSYIYHNENILNIPMHIYFGHKQHYINVDCGCSFYAKKGNPNGRLGCLRLEDFKEFYI